MREPRALAIETDPTWHWLTVQAAQHIRHHLQGSGCAAGGKESGGALLAILLFWLAQKLLSHQPFSFTANIQFLIR